MPAAYAKYNKQNVPKLSPKPDFYHLAKPIAQPGLKDFLKRLKRRAIPLCEFCAFFMDFVVNNPFYNQITVSGMLYHF
jgi:hypothetical protein